jgi:hypothetical protein
MGGSPALFSPPAPAFFNTQIGTGEIVIAIACQKCGNIELVLERVPREYAERKAAAP